MAVIIGAVTLLSACASASPEVSVDDPVLIEGREIYIKNCVSCHGGAGEGGVGQPLNDGSVAAKYPTVADQIEIVADGRKNMPAYAGRLSPEELEAVVRYTREVL